MQYVLPATLETTKLLEVKQDHFFAVVSYMQYQKDAQNITHKFDKLDSFKVKSYEQQTKLTEKASYRLVENTFKLCRLWRINIYNRKELLNSITKK